MHREIKWKERIETSCSGGREQGDHYITFVERKSHSRLNTEETMSKV